MSNADPYKCAEGIQTHITENLEELGFDVNQPRSNLELRDKIRLLNYLRSIETTIGLVKAFILNDEDHYL